MKWLCLVMVLIPTCSHAGEIHLAWDANTESDLAGYRIYYGLAPRTGTDPKVCGLCGYLGKVDARNVTDFLVSNLGLGSTYYVSATAYDASGNESGFSNEVLGGVRPSAPV